MSTTQPIRSKQLLHDFKEYYLTKQPNSRNYTLILIGLSLAQVLEKQVALGTELALLIFQDACLARIFFLPSIVPFL